MNCLNSIKASFGIALVGACAALAPSSHAQIENRFWQTNSSTDYNETWIYNNFSATAAAGRNFSTWTDPAGQAGVKYFDYDFYLTASAQTGCYEIYTVPETGNTLNTDTRIWAQPGGLGSFVMLSDDINGANDRTSYARIWIGSMRGIMFRVQGFSAASNTIDFKLKLYKRKEATATACEAAGKPFVNYTGTPIYKNTN